MSDKRLIEEAFPLKQASIDSVHEKNVRHGHISTLHIWPARRPLAACRAALITTLLPDPGDPKARAELVRRIGGEIVSVPKKVKQKDGTEETKIVEATVGGILHWGREQNEDVAYFRDEIRKAYGGKAPKVLDMFAGGGAIPLEAMRLGCDVTAIDYNPVAWFLLKCTLEYPQKLAGKNWPLPAQKPVSDPDLIPKQGALDFAGKQKALGDELPQQMGDLAAHVQWWGNWVLERARKDLAAYYPTHPLDTSRLKGDDNPLCPTVAYLWARTVPHPDPKLNGLRVPLLKTLWLCKKANKKRALRLNYNADENRFDFEVFTPQNDAEVGAGTMTRTGVECPPIGDGKTGVFLRMEYLQQCGKIGQMGAVCTAVVVDVPRIRGSDKDTLFGKEYRLPTREEDEAAEISADMVDALAAELPYGFPCEPIIPPDSRAVFVHLYGLNTFDKLFTPRQLLSLGTFVKHTRTARSTMQTAYAAVTQEERSLLIEGLTAYLTILQDRLTNYMSTICVWENVAGEVKQTFLRFALPMTWDFAESNPISNVERCYLGAIDSVYRVLTNLAQATSAGKANIVNGSATESLGENLFDAIVTDPPYYDAIPYAELADFFYVWLRRTVGDNYGAIFANPLSPKIGELVQQAGRNGSKNEAKQFYEDGMFQAFQVACHSLKPDGCMVIVFAHKQPDAWETLTTAMIRAGFVVTASWPIDTEMSGGIRNHNRASLSSSVWLVCRKRPDDAGKGWYKQVQPRMKERITERLRYFWDIGVRGPDFLWAAIGPGLEAFSAYDEVRRNDGKPFSVSEFLKEVRRLTTDFALGQIVSGGTEGLDEWTRYALMHAANFGTGGAPVGECILLSGAYGLDLNSLTGPRGILTKAKAKPVSTDNEAEAEEGADESGGSGSELRLLRWDERKRDDLGEMHPTFGLPYLDMLHRLVREWANGDVSRVTEYAARNGLGQNELFWKVAQAFAEVNEPQSRERTLLEAVIAWGRGRSLAVPTPVSPLQTGRLDFEETL
ncbi:MAG: DUF1156 domain-containing protein [Armatimonadetes bacterium]|nr:DUF1156 domain-containing protein [Armatimonadota bacterium]